MRRHSGAGLCLERRARRAAAAGLRHRHRAAREGDWQITYDSAGSRILDRRAPVPAVPVPRFPSRRRKTGAGRGPARPDDLLDQPDPAIYGVDAFYPAAPVVTGGDQWQRGRRLLAVRVFPSSIIPSQTSCAIIPTSRLRCRDARGGRERRDGRSGAVPRSRGRELRPR